MLFEISDIVFPPIFRFGNIEDEIAGTLCRKLHAIGWHVSHKAVVRNEVRQDNMWTIQKLMSLNERPCKYLLVCVYVYMY